MSQNPTLLLLTSRLLYVATFLGLWMSGLKLWRGEPDMGLLGVTIALFTAGWGARSAYIRKLERLRRMLEENGC